MKQQRILSYGISFCLVLLFSFTVQAQTEETKTTKEKDSTSIKKKYGLRLGADASKLVRSFIDDDYSGFELVADYRITQNLYIAGEIGTEERTTSTEF